jgi:RNA polymerase sigma-70 factor (ECF subfamily)
MTFISWEAEDPEGRYRVEAPGEWSAERIYERRWALTVLENAMVALRAEYAEDGRLTLFRELQPFISGDDTERYPQLAARLGMSEGALRVAVHRLRRRYGDQVRVEIAKVVERPEEIEEEVRHLLEALA